MDFRRIFDNRVPAEEFDKWRTRYCDECFADTVKYAKLDAGKTALEIGPGTVNYEIIDRTGNQL